MKRTNVLFALAFFVGTVMIPGSLYPWTSWGTKYGDSYLPADMYADQAGNPNYTGEFSAMRRGALTWNNVTTSYFDFSWGGWLAGGIQNNDKNQNFWDYLDPGILGTSWLVSNGPNREVDIEFDINTNWNMGPGSTGGNQIDFESVACHEFGHNLGLGHSSVFAATMYAYMYYGDDSKRTLDQDDINGINSLY